MVLVRIVYVFGGIRVGIWFEAERVFSCGTTNLAASCMTTVEETVVQDHVLVQPKMSSWAERS
jgi:hypothetical protein